MRAWHRQADRQILLFIVQQAKAWSRFFCHSVYVTMYLNDHARASFYESLGLNTTQFNRCGAVPESLASTLGNSRQRRRCYVWSCAQHNCHGVSHSSLLCAAVMSQHAGHSQMIFTCMLIELLIDHVC